MCAQIWIFWSVKRGSSFAFSIGRPWPLVCPLAGPDTHTNWFLCLFPLTFLKHKFSMEFVCACVRLLVCDLCLKLNLNQYLIICICISSGLAFAFNGRAAIQIQSAECTGRHSCLTPYPVSGECNILHLQVNIIAILKQNWKSPLTYQTIEIESWVILLLCLLSIFSTLQDLCEYSTRNIVTGQNYSPRKAKVTTGKMSCIRTQHDSMDSFKIANTAPRCYAHASLMPTFIFQQACKPQRYDSSKLWPTDQPIHSAG